MNLNSVCLQGSGWIHFPAHQATGDMPSVLWVALWENRYHFWIYMSVFYSLLVAFAVIVQRLLWNLRSSFFSIFQMNTYFQKLLKESWEGMLFCNQDQLRLALTVLSTRYLFLSHCKLFAIDLCPQQSDSPLKQLHKLCEIDTVHKILWIGKGSCWFRH